MDILEIALLAIGLVLCVLGFVLPVGKRETTEQTKELAKEEIAVMVADEMDKVKAHVDEVVDEAVEYAVEKTERSLERLSNEKIMAVNEYSDTVLQEIHKNHEEVMFLYDMLNDKHTNLKNTVSEVNKTVKEAEATKQEAEAVVYSFLQMGTESVAKEEKPKVEERMPAYSTPLVNASVPITDVNFVGNTDEQGRNSNDRILELHKEGKSKVTIARELGLGVGEVKLVIDLYKNSNRNA